MKKLLFLFLGILLLSRCGVPVNAVFDSARLLEEGRGEFGVSSAFYLFNSMDSTTHMRSDTTGAFFNTGMWAGFHAAKRLDIRMRWEWIGISEYPDAHYIQLNPKFSIVHNRLALAAPGAVYLFTIDPDADETRAYWEFSPQLLATMPIADWLDLSLAGRVAFISRTSGIYPGFNLGFSFWRSGNLFDRDLRLDLGFMPVRPIWHWDDTHMILSTSPAQFPLWSIGFAVVLQ